MDIQKRFMDIRVKIYDMLNKFSTSFLNRYESLRVVESNSLMLANEVRMLANDYKPQTGYS